MSRTRLGRQRTGDDEGGWTSSPPPPRLGKTSCRSEVHLTDGTRKRTATEPGREVDWKVMMVFRPTAGTWRVACGVSAALDTKGAETRDLGSRHSAQSSPGVSAGPGWKFLRFGPDGKLERDWLAL